MVSHSAFQLGRNPERQLGFGCVCQLGWAFEGHVQLLEQIAVNYRSFLEKYLRCGGRRRPAWRGFAGRGGGKGAPSEVRERYAAWRGVPGVGEDRNIGTEALGSERASPQAGLGPAGQRGEARGLLLRESSEEIRVVVDVGRSRCLRRGAFGRVPERGVELDVCRDGRPVRGRSGQESTRATATHSASENSTL